MGPVWDFDLGYGNSRDEKSGPEQWLIRKYGWDRFLFKNKDYEARIRNYWENNHPIFVSILDSIDSTSNRLSKASLNEFKIWPTLGNNTDWPLMRKYDSYQEAVDTLKAWIERRIQWIDENI